MAVHERELARCGTEMVAELAESIRGDGREHVPRTGEVRQEDLGPTQDHEGVGDLVVADLELGVDELVVEAAEQQFLHLAHDEEAHLVVAGAAGVLKREQQIDALVVDVGIRGALELDEGRARCAGCGGGTSLVGGDGHGTGVWRRVYPGWVDDPR